MPDKIIKVRTVDGDWIEKKVREHHLDATVQDILQRGVRMAIDNVINIFPANRIQRIEVYDEGSNTPQLSAERKAVAAKPAGKRGGRKPTGSVVPGPGRTDGD